MSLIKYTREQQRWIADYEKEESRMWPASSYYRRPDQGTSGAQRSEVLKRGPGHHDQPRSLTESRPATYTRRISHESDCNKWLDEQMCPETQHRYASWQHLHYMWSDKGPGKIQ